MVRGGGKIGGDVISTWCGQGSGSHVFMVRSGLIGDDVIVATVADVMSEYVMSNQSSGCGVGLLR